MGNMAQTLFSIATNYFSNIFASMMKGAGDGNAELGFGGGAGTSIGGGSFSIGK